MIFFKSRNKIILIGVLNIFVQHYVVKSYTTSSSTLLVLAQCTRISSKMFLCAHNTSFYLSNLMVPLTGFEPVRVLLRRILSPLCLPIPPQRRISVLSVIASLTPKFYLIMKDCCRTLLGRVYVKAFA